MGFIDIIQGLMARFTGVKPVGESDSHSHLPSSDNRIDIDATPKQIEPLKPPVIPGVNLANRTHDRRSVASKKHVYGTRPWSKVTGICLHQTACVLGENPGRWDTVGCHIGVTRGGLVIKLHNYDSLVVHGNGWNSQTVGIEIDGTYEGIQGDPKTFWRDPSDTKSQPQRLTSATIEATQQIIRDICQEVESHGGKITALVAHRQASANRRNDPGSEIWQRIALPMSIELNLNDGGKGFKIGTGLAIPEAWDSRNKGSKY